MEANRNALNMNQPTFETTYMGPAIAPRTPHEVPRRVLPLNDAKTYDIHLKHRGPSTNPSWPGSARERRGARAQATANRAPQGRTAGVSSTIPRARHIR